MLRKKTLAGKGHMKTLDTGHEKIQKICDILRKETLEPAHKEAQSLIEEAKQQAEQILAEAHQHSEKIIADARRVIEQERNVFHSSLSQSAKQSLEALRQAIEQRLFNQELHQLILRDTANPQVIAKLIDAIVKALEKEGLAADLIAVVPSSISAKEVNSYLAADILNKLKDHSVTLGNIGGGVRIRIEDKKMTLDISDAEIEDLLQRYLRKDFRKMIFGELSSSK